MICSDAPGRPADTIGWWSDWEEKLSRLHPYQSLKHPQEATFHYKYGAERFSETSERCYDLRTQKSVGATAAVRTCIQFIIVVWYKEAFERT